MGYGQDVRTTIILRLTSKHMGQALIKPITFDEFIEWYPENSEVRYELHDGVIVDMAKPKGKHSRVTGFTINHLNI